MTETKDLTSGFVTGITCVRVMRREIHEGTKKELIRECHSGIVVQTTTSFVRVFNPAPIDKGGDPSPEYSQWFPVSSPRCWVEITTNRKEAFPIPATLR